MTRTATVPFVLKRAHGVVSGREITSTREEAYGLLHLEGGQLVAQWSTAREVSRVGQEIRVDRDLGPVQKVALPLSALAGAHVRWRMFPWPPRWQLVLRAADLEAFAALAGGTGLLLEHPAELNLDIRRVDRAVARAFIAELELALADAALEAAAEQPAVPSAEHATPPRQLGEESSLQPSRNRERETVE
jgi:hypothetical protein